MAASSGEQPPWWHGVKIYANPGPFMPDYLQTTRGDVQGV